MADEEIEKALYNADDIAISEDVDCCDILNYIKRLKEQIYQTEQKLSECEVGYQATLDLERRMRADEKEQVRKDTAKEILQLVESVKSGKNGIRYHNSDFYGVKS